jgi:hypothetical protein
MLAKLGSPLLLKAFVGAIVFTLTIEATNIVATSTFAPKRYREWHLAQVDRD